ncbi:hypothetical protein [Haloparvum sedimenti]|uniref:hypothetical protein n=1 Tax=Haloparvum sedimenti TaxID=1678448 RepID=UPI00071E7F81|nr:hypothetical protein [Haloparvum sedimenti]
MSDHNPHALTCIGLEEPEQIDDLAQLQVGDRVLIDERRRPQTVVATGTRTAGIEGRDVEERVPVVRVEGHWAGAATVEMTHDVTLTEIADDLVSQRVVPEGERVGPIVAMDGVGRELEVRRTHVAGADARAQLEQDGGREEVSA